MTKAILNFVWIGEPKLNDGGQDVIGLVTIGNNLTKFSTAESKPNPMVFWCQSTYKKTYEDYFRQNKLTISVVGIDDYLTACCNTAHQTHHHQAQRVLTYYHQLLEQSERNQIIDRVYIKDMFFRYLLAKQGHYVLDTNMMPLKPLDTPINFPEYSTDMFPWTTINKTKENCEVWMLYAPPDNLTRANHCLDFYLDQFEKYAITTFNATGYTKAYHAYAGTCARNALLLTEDMRTVKKSNFIPQPDRISTTQPTDQSHTCQIWDCAEMQGISILVPMLKVCKKYYNSHLFNSASRYNIAHQAVLHEDIEPLKFMLNHGISPDLTSTSEGITETLLEVAVDEENVAAVRLLLAHGANPLLKIQGCTALDNARERAHPIILSLILEYLALPENLERLGLTTRQSRSRSNSSPIQFFNDERAERPVNKEKTLLNEFNCRQDDDDDDNQECHATSRSTYV